MEVLSRMKCPKDGKRCYIKQEHGLPSKCRNHPEDLFLRDTFCSEGITFFNSLLSSNSSTQPNKELTERNKEVTPK